MLGVKFKEQRKTLRYPTEIKGRIMFEDAHPTMDCEIVNVGEKGIGVWVKPVKTLGFNVGSKLIIEVYTTLFPVHIKGMFKRIDLCSNGYILGIEVIKNDTNLVYLLLDDIKPVCKFGFGNIMPFHWLSNQHNS